MNHLHNRHYWTAIILSLLTVLLFCLLLIGIAVSGVRAQESGDFHCTEGETYVSCTSEYTLTQSRFANGAVTWQCAYPQIGQALALWGQWSGFTAGACVTSGPVDITFVIVPDSQWQFGSNVVGVASWSGRNGVTLSCTVQTRERHSTHIGILAHEVGHCGGLGHTNVPNQLMNPYCCSPIGSDDIAGMQALYGLPAGATPTPTAPFFTATPVLPTATPTRPPGGCASSIWLNPDGTVNGPHVSCGPYRLTVPGLARD